MRTGAGLGLSLALLLAGGGTLFAAGADPAELGAVPASDPVRLEFAPNAATLVRPLTLASLPTARFALSYYQPLVQILTFGPQTWGPDGALVLPGARRFRSRLSFRLAGGAWERELAPTGGEATVSLSLTPPVLRETWVWPDGLRLERTCFQPPVGKGVGIRFLLHNPAAEPIPGLRLTARLQDPELTGRSPRDAQESDDRLLVDPRLEVLYQYDGRTRDESWLAAGWSPQGGRISGGEEAAAGEGAEITVRLESPAYDLGPGQTQEEVFWLAWNYDQGSVSRDLIAWRELGQYETWERTCRKEAAGPRFECRDPNLVFLFQTLRGWAAWVRRQDEYGSVFLAPVADPEPAAACELAEGASGYAWLGRGRDLTAACESWAHQRLELKDLPSAILAVQRTWRVTRDLTWLRDNLVYVQEWLDMLAAMDENGDGLPDYFGAVPPHPERYPAFPALDWGPDPGVLYLDAALAAILALRAGAELLEAAGGAPEQLEAVRYRSLGEQAASSLDASFWSPNLGARGYYAYAVRPRTKERALHRGLAAATVIPGRIGRPERRAAVFTELWEGPGWRGPHGAFRTLPTDDPDFNGDAVPGRGAVSNAKTHLVLLAALARPGSSSEALERLRAYARDLVHDPASLGWSRPAGSPLSAVGPGEYSFIELLVQGLAGLEAAPEGLRVHIPAYTEDLGIRFEGLVYGGRRLDLEVQGPGGRPGGTVQVNGKPLPDGGLVPAAWLAGPRTRILISRSPDQEPDPSVH